MKAFVLIAFVVESLADSSRFKSCENSSFCVRFKAWSRLTSRPDRQLKLDNVNTDQAYSTGVVDFAFNVKSTAEAESNYGVTISVNTASAVVRVRMDDTRSSNPRRRYRIPDGDVVVPPQEKPLSRYTYTTSAEMTSIQVRNLYRLEVEHSSFKIRVFNKNGHLVQVINAKNTLAFEKYRKDSREVCTDQRSDPACHPEINPTGAWDETFGRFRDVKIYGPSLVGIDVEHVESVSVHGLPEHTTGFNLPFSTDFRFFNADVFQYPLDSGSALYGSIPLLTSLHSNPSPSVSAILWLNPSDTFVTLDRSSSSGISSSWVSETGIIDFAIFVGPSPADILKQYHYLTGLPTLPPIFALGYQQSKWGYKSQEEVMAISHRFTAEQISLDVLWLDIQYTDDKKYFTWDPTHYGNPEQLVAALTADERKLVTIIDPHIKADSSYSVFSSLQERDFFVKLPDTRSDFTGDCWPGKSSYPDFTRPDVRAFWGSLYSYNHFHGTSPDVWIWNDMNEPSVFDGPEMSFPRNLVHAGNIEHRELHNLYGMYYHRSTYEGLLKRDNMNIPRRPFVLSRSFFAGSHRFGPIWTGDNNSEWSHLKASIPMLLSLSISGMSFSGADVGGFFGDPSKELYIRWQQAGAAFYPFYRCHAHHDSKYREPWTFDDETTKLVKNAISLRYMMLPYWYTQFALYAIEGLPIIRPMWFDFMSKDIGTFADPKLSAILENQVMVGDKILVRPIVDPGVTSVTVYLPDSKSWWYTLDGSSFFEGGQTIEFPVTLKTIPVFVKAGTILPLKRTERMSTKQMKNDPYTFRVYEALVTYEAPTGLLYMDDEESMDYAMHENFALIRLEYEGELKWTQIGGKRDDIADLNQVVGIEVVNKKGLTVVRTVGSSSSFSLGNDMEKDRWMYLVIVVFALIGVAVIAMYMLRRRRGRNVLPRSVHELVSLTSFNRED